MKTLGIATICSVVPWTLARTAQKAHRWFLSGAGVFGALSTAVSLLTPQKNIDKDRSQDMYAKDKHDSIPANPVVGVCVVFGAGSVVGALICYPIGRYLAARPVALLTGSAAGLVGGFGTTTTIRSATQPKTEQAGWFSWVKW